MVAISCLEKWFSFRNRMSSWKEARQLNRKPNGSKIPDYDSWRMGGLGSRGTAVTPVLATDILVHHLFQGRILPGFIILGCKRFEASKVFF